MGRNRIGAWIATASSVAAVLAATAPAAAQPAAFAHGPHLSEGLECAGCHDATARTPPVLKTGACGDCHDGAPEVAPKPFRHLEAAFPHAPHTGALDCKDCHAATVDGSRKSGAPLMTAGRCFDCHRENGVDVPESKCASCHAPGRRTTPPADHAGPGWQERHGREADLRVFGKHGSDCGLCHANNACVACHHRTAPRSHTGLWRVRTHGAAASWDRDGCKNCHETGSCVACHRRTPPGNHRGSWKQVHGLAAGSRTSAECAVCHEVTWCAACHKGGR